MCFWFINKKDEIRFEIRRVRNTGFIDKRIRGGSFWIVTKKKRSVVGRFIEMSMNHKCVGSNPSFKNIANVITKTNR